MSNKTQNEKIETNFKQNPKNLAKIRQKFRSATKGVEKPRQTTVRKPRFNQ